LEDEYTRKSTESTPPKKRIRIKIEGSKENIQKGLLEAIKKDNIATTEEIINKEKIDLNKIRDEDGFAPLHLAVARNQQEIVNKFLENGVNPNVRDSEGNTPLHFAAEANNLGMLKLLSKHRGNVNAVNEYNWSVLHSAASGIINEKED